MKHFYTTALAMLLLGGSSLFAATAGEDITAQWITNGDFETGTLDGWTNSGMQTQNNSYFTSKNGSYYVEAWVSRGGKLGNCSVTQNLALPEGKYRLKAVAMFIQQNGSNSVVNEGDPQTGGYIFAGDYTTAITDMGEYALDFAVIKADAETPIGVKAENATANWITADNFRLVYLGALDTQTIADYVAKLQATAEGYLACGVESAVAAELNTAIAAAKAAIAENPLSEANLRAAIALLEDANAKAEVSIARFDALKDAIAYAEKVVGWWQDLDSK